VVAQNSVRRLKKKEKRPAERLSLVSGDDDDGSVGTELGHGGGFGRPRGKEERERGRGNWGN
jgi:hypothetical protein